MRINLIDYFCFMFALPILITGELHLIKDIIFKSRLVCETCGIKITKKNFWKHKHPGYIFK